MVGVQYNFCNMSYIVNYIIARANVVI